MSTCAREQREVDAAGRQKVSVQPHCEPADGTQLALEDADLGDRRFDRVFLQRRPFWQQPDAALGAVREYLAPDGAFFIFWAARHWGPERARDLGNELAGRLRESGFSVDRVLVEDLRPVPAVCVMGRPHGR